MKVKCVCGKKYDDRNPIEFGDHQNCGLGRKAKGSAAHRLKQKLKKQ